MKDAKKQETSRIPIWQKALFGSGFAVVLMLITLIAIEGFLVLVDLGHSHRFYESTTLADGTSAYKENRWFALPYFTVETLRRPQSFRLSKNKPPSELRVFVLGSSAAMGDPEPSFSASRMLQRMFEVNYPEYDVEVVNAAMTAINSHTVRRIARDCARLEPDAFLVYEGNNEVIGPYGPTGVLSGVSSNPFLTDLSIFLRERRIVHVLTGLSRKSVGDIDSQWGGMQMFLDHVIESDDPRLQTVRMQFERNLNSIVKYGLRSNADVILSTVLVNQRGFAPFKSADPDLPPGSERLNTYEQLLTEGDAAMGSGNWTGALDSYLKAWSLDANAASLAFRIGRVYLALDHDADADRFLKQALELDTLRFRTSSELNSSIRQLVSKFEMDDGFEFVDIDGLFSQASPNGIAGDEWFYEHVHFNAYGNYQLARVWYLKLIENWNMRGLVNDIRSEIPSYKDLSRSLGYTLYEQGMIANELCDRLNRAPFTSQMDARFKLDQWKETLGKIGQELEKKSVVLEVIATYEAAVSVYSDDAILLRNYGMMLCAFSKFEEALIPLARAYGLRSSDPDTLFAYAIALKATKDVEKFEQMKDELKKLEPRYPGLKTI